MKTTATILASAFAFALATPAFAEGTTHEKQLQEKFSKLDTNKNGALTQAEFTAGGQSAEAFAAADTDRNGSLTLSELRAYHDDDWNESSAPASRTMRAN